MIEVTSATRTPAKRLLNNWHDSRAVRTWTLAELTARLNAAVNEGLITREGVLRVLNADKPEMPKGHKHNGHGEKQEHDGAEIQDTPEAGDSEGDDGEGNGAEGDDTGEGDGESEGEEQGEGEQKNGKPKNGCGNGQDEQPQEQVPFDPAIVQKMIDEALRKHKEQDGHATRRVIIKDKDAERKIDGAHYMLPDVLRYIKAGLNVALVGPAGTGKSTIAHMVAKILGKEFRGCGALLSKYDLVGFIDAAGTYHSTPLYDAYVNGHLFCFDEFDASAPDAGVAFNAITDNQNVYAFPNGMHTKHEGFVAIACMNTWGSGADADYVGRFKQDAASMSRFVRVYIDYDRNIEEQLGDKDIVKRIWQLRDACKTLGVRHVVSTRMIIQAQAARDVGTPNSAIDRDVLFAGLNESTIKQLAAQMKAGS